jgi:ATP-dependent DNA ligase
MTRGSRDFQLLQRRQKRPSAPVVCYLFDVLWSNGRDVTDKSVLQRRGLLGQTITETDGIQIGCWIPDRVLLPGPRHWDDRFEEQGPSLVRTSPKTKS